MKIVFIVLGIAAPVVIVVSCTRSKPKELTVLNYDDMILLDAEDLDEGSIGPRYKEDIIPVLQQYVSSAAEVVEELDAEAGSYKVISQGQTYVIYSPGNGCANFRDATGLSR